MAQHSPRILLLFPQRKAGSPSEGFLVPNSAQRKRMTLYHGTVLQRPPSICSDFRNGNVTLRNSRIAFLQEQRTLAVKFARKVFMDKC